MFNYFNHSGECFLILSELILIKYENYSNMLFIIFFYDQNHCFSHQFRAKFVMIKINSYKLVGFEKKSA